MHGQPGLKHERSITFIYGVYRAYGVYRVCRIIGLTGFVGIMGLIGFVGLCITIEQAGILLKYSLAMRICTRVQEKAAQHVSRI